MRVLFVCSGNSGDKKFSLEKQQPFVDDQRKSLIKKDIKVGLFLIKGRGLIGYLKNILPLRKKIIENGYDLIHAHFGITGMLAVMQRICPVFISFQGSDINRKDLRIISKFAIRLAAHSIFMTQELADKANIKNNYSIIPYGVDWSETFFPLDKDECRQALGLEPNEKIVLFSSSFDRVVKNYPLAKKAVDLVGGLRMIELLTGYSRNEINLLINASDMLLMTSFNEGSPQVIKEAMACNCPIVTTDVGDVKKIIDGTKGCYITSYDQVDISNKIKKVLELDKRTDGRKRIQEFDVNKVADNIIQVYKRVLGAN
jgi:glycosyltransferase involved in cell wall biosynthesis